MLVFSAQAGFLVPFLLYIFFKGHIRTFCKLWNLDAAETAQKSKNLLRKCVLQFNFAPIKGSGFFIFQFKFVVPYYPSFWFSTWFLGKYFHNDLYCSLCLKSQLFCCYLEKTNIFYISLAGQSVLATPLLKSPILYISKMSGFEPKELPQQAGALPNWPPISLSHPFP